MSEWVRAKDGKVVGWKKNFFVVVVVVAVLRISPPYCFFTFCIFSGPLQINRLHVPTLLVFLSHRVVWLWRYFYSTQCLQVYDSFRFYFHLHGDNNKTTQTLRIWTNDHPKRECSCGGRRRKRAEVCQKAIDNHPFPDTILSSAGNFIFPFRQRENCGGGKAEVKIDHDEVTFTSMISRAQTFFFFFLLHRLVSPFQFSFFNN